MRSIVSQLIMQMTREEKLALLAELRGAIAEDLAAASDDPQRCPLCGCGAFVRKGRGRDGSQRWECKGCGRTFSAKTGSLLANSNLGPASG